MTDRFLDFFSSRIASVSYTTAMPANPIPHRDRMDVYVKVPFDCRLRARKVIVLTPSAVTTTGLPTCALSNGNVDSFCPVVVPGISSFVLKNDAKAALRQTCNLANWATHKNPGKVNTITRTSTANASAEGSDPVAFGGSPTIPMPMRIVLYHTDKIDNRPTDLCIEGSVNLIGLVSVLFTSVTHTHLG